MNEQNRLDCIGELIKEKNIIKIQRDVIYTQAKNCRLCLHIGTVAIFIGHQYKEGLRIELLTPFHKFRIYKGEIR
jgi:hypothetical protein